MGILSACLGRIPQLPKYPSPPGIPMRELSPMFLGPVEHGEADLPPANNLENYYQFAKVYPQEVDESGTIKEEFYHRRRASYQSSPMRHKFPGSLERPLYSLYQGRRHDYLGGRTIYCRLYAQLVGRALSKLRELRKDGYNLRICGYDAFPFTSAGKDYATLCAEFAAHYADLEKPFGHEAVIAALLYLRAVDYPWCGQA